ncbi:unnamed protein product, partial [Mesorhabditis belari]|uniref:Aminomethyltransferase folate-binding domain-containing protein n=1 Tax=Mesorhabditis belari TaxID=2138241 RepID=A0AAF3F574_9BILA
MSKIIQLTTRALLSVRGPDAVGLMQGLVTNDIRRLKEAKLMAAFLLNTKGRIVEDLLIYNHDEGLLVECSSKHRGELKQILEKYKMRKQAEITESEDAIFYSSAPTNLPDPRTAGLGFRLIGKHTANAPIEEYTNFRFSVGVAEGKEELDDMLPFQANGDILQYVSLDKGCYIGQELTARTAHTGVIRRRIIPFTCDEKLAPSGEVLDDEGRKVGATVASTNGAGLALLQLNSTGRTLSVDKHPIVPHRPAWMPEKYYATNSEKK